MDYLLITQTHVTCAVLSYAGFLVRGIGMMREAAWLRRRWVKVLPHVVDTMLLLSALALAVTLQQYPFVHPWLTAKVVALALYIALGMVALGRGGTRPVRIAAWIAAQVVFGYIVLVALTRHPLPGAA